MTALGWPHHTSTPGRPDTNGVAERAVRTIVEGTRAALFQAGMPEMWWPYAMEHFCVAHNAVGGAKGSPWVNRTGKRFPAPLIPFGAMIEFLLSATRGSDAKFAPRAIMGVMIGYHIQPGAKWKGDIYALSLDDVSANKEYTLRSAHVQRVKSWVHPLASEAFVFPLKQELPQELLQCWRPTAAKPKASGKVCLCLFSPGAMGSLLLSLNSRTRLEPPQQQLSLCPAYCAARTALMYITTARDSRVSGEQGTRARQPPKATRRCSPG